MNLEMKQSDYEIVFLETFNTQNDKITFSYHSKQYQLNVCKHTQWINTKSKSTFAGHFESISCYSGYFQYCILFIDK